jgi:topoisomerase IA-like protein|tara:strand:- start:500 stop:745 length:246 start_codon:yes stop_codon:yes gene_type:complete
MYDEYIAKAQSKINSKFGNKQEACALLLKAIALLKEELAELKSAPKPAAKKPAAKKPAAKKPAAKKAPAKKTAAKKSAPKK